MKSKLRQVKMYQIQLRLKQLRDSYGIAETTPTEAISLALAKSIEELAFIVDDLASTIDRILDREGRRGL